MKFIRSFQIELFCTVMTAMLIAAIVVMFQTCSAIDEAFLIKGDGYPLINEYRYGVLNSGRHQLLRGDKIAVELGYHLNRIYFNDRYIVGEITEKRRSYERRSQHKRYTFFIFDTEMPETYQSGLTDAEFKAELKELGIHNEVNLVDRDSKKWLQKQ